MVLGDWDRAVNQLKVIGEVDASALPMVHAYRTAIQCERLRADVFAGTRGPLLFGDPEPWIAMLMQSLTMLGAGQASQAAELRAQALEEAPAPSGTLNGAHFEWIADADSRLGPMLEVLLNGAYYWVPMHRIASVTIEPPGDARDLVWLPASSVDERRRSDGIDSVALPWIGTGGGSGPAHGPQDRVAAGRSRNLSWARSAGSGDRHCRAGCSSFASCASLRGLRSLTSAVNLPRRLHGRTESEGPSAARAPGPPDRRGTAADGHPGRAQQRIDADPRYFNGCRGARTCLRGAAAKRLAGIGRVVRRWRDAGVRHSGTSRQHGDAAWASRPAALGGELPLEAILQAGGDAGAQLAARIAIAARCSMRRLREAVLRDLGWLLNSHEARLTRRHRALPGSAQLSVLNFGLPTLAGRQISSLDPQDGADASARHRLLRAAAEPGARHSGGQGGRRRRDDAVAFSSRPSCGVSRCRNTCRSEPASTELRRHPCQRTRRETLAHGSAAARVLQPRAAVHARDGRGVRARPIRASPRGWESTASSAPIPTSSGCSRAFALLAARVQLKLDARHPEFTQHLLEMVYPQFLAPGAVLRARRIRARPEGNRARSKACRVPRGSALRTQLARGDRTACEFRTAQDMTLWPLR